MYHYIDNSTINIFNLDVTLTVDPYYAQIQLTMDKSIVQGQTLAQGQSSITTINFNS